MTQLQKSYPYSPGFLYNLACDIVEMYKAEITRQDGTELFGFTTEMYGQKTDYLFRIEKQREGCLLSVETPGENESAEKQLAFMFSLVDNMLAQLPGNG